MPAVETRVLRLSGIRLCSQHARLLADFYERALSFRCVAVEHLAGAPVQARFSVSGRALRIVLELGSQSIELIEFVDHPGSAYPRDTATSDLIFQHFAIVVSDMPAAMQRLSMTSGWSPITVGGPQHLPKTSGGVTAFKFRDPEGHPLELLAFPADATPKHWQHKNSHHPFLGIDHSAISVSDSARSVAFYAALGMSISNTSTNEGPAQAHLDCVERPLVKVTAMIAAEDTPHLELLDYSHRSACKPLALQSNDVAATCLIFEADSSSRPQRGIHAPTDRLVDPDGHHLSIV